MKACALVVSEHSVSLPSSGSSKHLLSSFVVTCVFDVFFMIPVDDPP